jgi:hypothetical protein
MNYLSNTYKLNVTHMQQKQALGKPKPRRSGRNVARRSSKLPPRSPPHGAIQRLKLFLAPP